MNSDKPKSLLKSLNFFYLALLFASVPLMLLFYGSALLCLRCTLCYVKFFDSLGARGGASVKESLLQREISSFLEKCSHG